MMQRIRALPSGTVGKAIPVAIKPPSKSARLKSIVFRPSPMMMGVMGVSLLGVVRPPMSKPADCSPCWKYSVFDHKRSIRPGSLSRRSKAAMQEAATLGGCDVEKRNGRARW